MTDSQKWLLITSTALFFWITYLLLPVITPFVISAVLAYLFDPLVDRLETRFSRPTAVILIFTLMVLLVLGSLLVIVPILQSEVISLIQRIPDMMQWIENELLPRISSVLGINVDTLDLSSVRNSLQDNWQNLGNIAGYLFVRITDSGQALLLWLANMLLVPVVTFYLLRDWDGILMKLKMLLPEKHENTTIKLVQECDSVLSEFLRGQLLVMLALAFIYATGLWIAGIEYSFLIGFIAGVISFVPYLGSIIGIGIAAIVAFFQFHDLLHLVFVALIFGVGQALEGMVLSPLLVGERIGLHPVAVIFAVMAGGQLFGFTGILLALPVAAVLLVLLRFVFDQYKSAVLAG